MKYILLTLLLLNSLLIVVKAQAETPIVSPASAAAPLQGSVQTEAHPYRIGPGDVLSVYVYNQADFTQPEVVVTADGYATFNNVGPIPVIGKTLTEITDTLSHSISSLVKVPRVTVNIVRTRPGVLYVSGAVIRPGLVQMATDPKSLASGGGGQQNGYRMDLRLTSALATTGGLLPTADLTHVVIKRSETGESETLNLWKLVKEGDASQDVLLYPGDAIIVPELGMAAMDDEDFKSLIRSTIGPGTFPVRIIGQVAKPGLYDINGISPYLNTAIARAEGYGLGANRQLIAIRRFTSNHTFTTLFVDPRKMDIALRPNDIVYVAERKVYATGRFFATISNVFSPFTNTATSAAVVISGVKR